MTQCLLKRTSHPQHNQKTRKSLETHGAMVAYVCVIKQGVRMSSYCSPFPEEYYSYPFSIVWTSFPKVLPPRSDYEADKCSNAFHWVSNYIWKTLMVHWSMVPDGNHNLWESMRMWCLETVLRQFWVLSPWLAWIPQVIRIGFGDLGVAGWMEQKHGGEFISVMDLSARWKHGQMAKPTYMPWLHVCE